MSVRNMSGIAGNLQWIAEETRRSEHLTALAPRKIEVLMFGWQMKEMLPLQMAGKAMGREMN